MLVDEKGPAHKKEFCIRLDIGTENYESSGTSIKRAQHSAAEVALGITKLSRPPVKTPKVEMPPSTPDKKCECIFFYFKLHYFYPAGCLGLLHTMGSVC